MYKIFKVKKNEQFCTNSNKHVYGRLMKQFCYDRQIRIAADEWWLLMFIDHIDLLTISTIGNNIIDKQHDWLTDWLANWLQRGLLFTLLGDVVYVLRSQVALVSG